MSETDSTESTDLFGGFISMPKQQIIQVALLGAVLGIVAWVLALLIKQAILTPLFCGNPHSGQCLGVANSAANTAAVFMAVIGLLGLVRLSIFRPLLIAVAVLVSLWGLGGWTAGIVWYTALGWSVVLYALCYLTFAWLVRPRAFAPTMGIVVVAVVLIRWLSML